MLETSEGDKIGESLTAAKQGIGMVTASRIAMAAPGEMSGMMGNDDAHLSSLCRNGDDSSHHEQA